MFSLAAVLLAACGEGRDGARLAALEAGLVSARASLSVFSPAGFAAPVTSGGARGSRLAASGTSPVRAAAVGPAPAVGARPAAASELLGAGPDALRRWFGEPDLRRLEGEGEVLLFLGAGCALDVVLYADAGAMRVAHAAARADGAAAVTEAGCLGGIGGGGGGWPGGGEVGRAASTGHTARR